MSPKVSVLIPVYNVEDYVEESIRSILNQDYKNLEILIFDDGSTDNTLNVVSSISDSRLKVYSSESNHGIVHSLNYLLAKANGEFILRHDGDDFCERDRVSRKLKYLTEEKLDIVACSTNAVDMNGNFIARRRVRIPKEDQLTFARLESPISHIWLCSRQVYQDVGNYAYDLKGVEDFDWLLRAIEIDKKVGVLSDYFGYTVRLNRTGNTQDLYGKRRYMLFEEARRRSLARHKIGSASNSFWYSKAEIAIKKVLHKKSFINMARFVLVIPFSKSHVKWAIRRILKLRYG